MRNAVGFFFISINLILWGLALVPFTLWTLDATRVSPFIFVMPDHRSQCFQWFFLLGGASLFCSIGLGFYAWYADPPNGDL